MKRKLLYILFLIPVFTSCLESPEMTTGIVNGKEKPTVITGQADPHCLDGCLYFQGEITSIGKAEITNKGFYWDTVLINQNNKGIRILSDANSDIFSCELKNASGDRTYYWRAFAENKHGEELGEIHSIQTPPIWEAKKELSGRGRGNGAVCVLDNKIYMFCGELERYSGGRDLTNVTHVYNGIDRWDELDEFPGDLRLYPVAFTIGNYIFVGTGSVFGTAVKDFYQLDNTLGSWTEDKIETPVDLEAREQSVAFSLNGKGYLVGGLSVRSIILDDVWQYDPVNGWVKKGNFPVRLSGGISISDDKRVFVGFGSSRTLWQYYEETDKWEVFTILPDRVGKTIKSGVIVRNAIYIVDENNTIWTLDMNNETKIWEEKAKLPEVFPDSKISGENQKLLTTGNSNSIYVGLGFTKLLYEYHPLWDN